MDEFKERISFTYTSGKDEFTNEVWSKAFRQYETNGVLTKVTFTCSYAEGSEPNALEDLTYEISFHDPKGKGLDLRRVQLKVDESGPYTANLSADLDEYSNVYTSYVDELGIFALPRSEQIYAASVLGYEGELLTRFSHQGNWLRLMDSAQADVEARGMKAYEAMDEIDRLLIRAETKNGLVGDADVDLNNKQIIKVLSDCGIEQKEESIDSPNHGANEEVELNGGMQMLVDQWHRGNDMCRSRTDIDDMTGCDLRDAAFIQLEDAGYCYQGDRFEEAQYWAPCQ